MKKKRKKMNSSLEDTSIGCPHRMFSGVDLLLRGSLKMKMTMMTKSQMMLMTLLS
uniref:Lysine acetyltransferase 6A n=1 Tax=Molossus molossus TaxID=27622 RepID=A0A7J8GLF9_MOLMO|nr:lysine acetyltransferase 6A [Molossus molossus]